MLPPPPGAPRFPYTTLFRSPGGPRAGPAPYRRRAPGDVPTTRSAASRPLTRTIGTPTPGTVPEPTKTTLSPQRLVGRKGPVDRKSTRLNSSHLGISYAVFCLNAAPTTRSSTLSLHDALPISGRPPGRACALPPAGAGRRPDNAFRGQPTTHQDHRHADPWDGPRADEDHVVAPEVGGAEGTGRSEEHTSELQSLRHLVCRLLLECCPHHQELHAFPTRRSSDLREAPGPGLRPTAGGRRETSRQRVPRPADHSPGPSARRPLGRSPSRRRPRCRPRGWWGGRDR